MNKYSQKMYFCQTTFVGNENKTNLLYSCHSHSIFFYSGKTRLILFRPLTFHFPCQGLLESQEILIFTWVLISKPKEKRGGK